MGEYARYGKEKIKIGTWNMLYYLRYDQRSAITPEPGNVDPCDPQQQKSLMFRFPFPWEDGMEPGSFEPFKDYTIPGFSLEGSTGHGHKQFTATGGYLLSMPCPESKEYKALEERNDGAFQLGLNGYPGAVSVAYQKKVEDELWTVVKCNGCGNLWRIDRDEAQQAADKLLEAADRYFCMDETDGRIKVMREIAKRIMSGYSDKKHSTTREAEV